MDDTIKGVSLGARVIDVIPNDDYELLPTFNNGEIRKFDAHQILDILVDKYFEFCAE